MNSPVFYEVFDAPRAETPVKHGVSEGPCGQNTLYLKRFMQLSAAGALHLWRLGKTALWFEK